MKETRWSLKTPEACLAELWKRIPGYIRLSFAAAVVMGLATHLYVFTNKLTNHDDIGHLFSATYGTASGRWLLPSILRLDGPFSVPWLIGLISVLCLAGTVCFTVSLLRIRRPVGCIVTAAVMVAFPTITATFTYMFTADAYFFGLMLAAFGAYAAVRLRYGVILGAVAITLSMGIYQSYLGVAAVLMVGALLFEVLDGNRSFKESFLKGLSLVGTLAAAVVAYMIIVKITTRHVALVDYMGISDMGKISLKELPHQILLSYGKYFTFFLRDDFNYHFGFLRYAFPVVGVCCAVLMVLLLRSRRLGAARTVLALALAAVYPLAGNLIYIMVPNGGVHTLMMFGLCYILIAPVALVSYMEPEAPEVSGHAFQKLAGWAILLTVALTAYSYMVTANTVYLSIDLSMRQCTAYSTRLLDKIESCEGYRRGMPVVLLGSNTAEEDLVPTPEVDSIYMVGAFDLANFRTCYTYGYFLRYYLGYTGEVYLGDSEKALTLAQTPEAKAMPMYPEAGSVRQLGDAIVVNLGGA